MHVSAVMFTRLWFSKKIIYCSLQVLLEKILFFDNFELMEEMNFSWIELRLRQFCTQFEQVSTGLTFEAID